MNIKTRNFLMEISITLVMFITSFCDFNGIYFVLCAPLLAAVIIIKNRYFLNAYLGMLFASILLPIRTSIVIINTTLAMVYLISLAIAKFKLKPLYHITFLGFFFGFCLTWLFSLPPVGGKMVNFLIVPFITAFFTYNIANISINLKSRDNFSLRKNELAFLGFIFVTIFFGLDNSILNVSLNLFVVLIFLYILARVDNTAVIITYLCCLGFKLPSEEYLKLFIVLTPLMFIYEPVSSNKSLGVGLFLIANGLILFLFNDYWYAIEIVPAILVMISIPEVWISDIKKYIVEPQDYQLKLFQKNYYRFFNKNLKIQKALQVLEEKIATDQKIKKHNKDLIMENISFLNGKLKEEENLHLKENILQTLNFKKADVVGLTMSSDLLENYRIVIEVKDSQIDLEEIMRVIENHLKVKLKKIHYSYNFIIRTHQYILVNEQKLKFNLSIKQRSKEGNYCGDSYLTFDIKNKKYLLISDGMGHGKKASKESGEALSLLRNFIELGIKPKDAIECCNALLFDREKESFNTLDLLEYDYFDNEIHLYKNGSGVTYLKKGDKVEKVVSENLPLGIVETINSNRIEINSDVDFIILTSDGFKKDFTEMLSKTKAKNSKAITQEIISYEGDKIDDDQTIMVINVIKNT